MKRQIDDISLDLAAAQRAIELAQELINADMVDRSSDNLTRAYTELTDASRHIFRVQEEI